MCSPSSQGVGAANTATFTGDLDGSDNWSVLCQVYPTETSNAQTDLPAFNYVNKYAKTFALNEDYMTGWYMPSIAELCQVYRNMNILNKVLSLLGGVPIDTCNYWSSSQGEKYNSAWTIRMSDGNIVGLGKSLSTNDYYKVRVCCVRQYE